MSDIRSGILTAVSYNPTILFLPIEMAGGLLGIHVILMLMGLIILKLSPFVWLITLVISWSVTAGFAANDPHLATVLRAIGLSKRSSRNIIPITSGVKYVP
jgi:hypothetical protein